MRRYVAGDAAHALSPHGRFALDPPRAPDEIPIISADRARELARAYVRTWGQLLERRWSEEGGITIEANRLQAQDRVYFADTPYGRFPDGFHPAFRKAYGPWYLVTMSQGGVPVLAVGVAAYDTDLRIDGHGRIVPQAQSGNEFESWAIGAARGALRPTAPEDAVARVGRATGVRTAATPRLLLRDSRQHPASAIWLLPLERGIRVRRAGGPPQEARTLFAGPNGRLFVAAAAQPPAEVTTAIRYTPAGERVGAETVRVPVRPGAAVEYMEVAIEEEVKP
jgi:hypothetical protein